MRQSFEEGRTEWRRAWEEISKPARGEGELEIQRRWPRDRESLREERGSLTEMTRRGQESSQRRKESRTEGEERSMDMASKAEARWIAERGGALGDVQESGG